MFKGSCVFKISRLWHQATLGKIMKNKRSEDKYFNVPIEIFSGFMLDHQTVLRNVADYAIYAHSLKLEFDSPEDKVKHAASYFNVTLGSALMTLNNGKKLNGIYQDGAPKTGISLPMFWDYFDNEKSDFEKICLLGFLAIKSILQKKSFQKLDNKYWLSRMDGRAKSVKEISELSKEIRFYANEYQTKKIKSSLVLNWGLVTYSRYTRGFYVSYKLSLEELIYEAEKKRISVREKEYKKMEQQALQNVLNRLKNEGHK